MGIARWVVPALAAWLGLALAACGGGENQNPDLGGQFTALVNAEQTHYDRMNGVDDVTAMHEECGRYAAEMDQRMAQLGTGCQDRMQAGKLSQANFDRWNGLADGMRTRIQSYQQGCEAGTDPVALHDLATRHHEEMGPLLDQMGAMMRETGMMGAGGMMGGGA